MDFTRTFWAATAAYIAIAILSTCLVLTGHLSALVYTIIVVASMVLFAVPFAVSSADARAEFGEGSLRITAPFVKVDIPYSGIVSVELSRGFDRGRRIYGYEGSRRVSGQFANGALGHYILAADTSVRGMIVVRHGGRPVAFNLGDERSTEEAYERLRGLAFAPGGTFVGEAPAARSRRPALWAGALVATSLVIAVIIVVAVMGSGYVSASLEDGTLSVDASFVDEDIAVEDISAVELRYGMEYGLRTGGLGSSGYLSGSFTNDEFGRYTLAVHRDVDAAIVVHHTGGVLVFNLGTGEETSAMYAELSAAIGTANA